MRLRAKQAGGVPHVSCHRWFGEIQHQTSVDTLIDFQTLSGLNNENTHSCCHQGNALL